MVTIELDGRVRVSTFERVLTLPSVTAPAVDRLATGETVTVEELPGLDPESQMVLIRRLVTEGLLVLED